MTVYVVQQPAKNKHNWTPDLSPAQEHGKIEYIFDGGESVYALPGPMLKKAQKTLLNFDPENDFILWPNSGDPAAIWTVCFALVILGFDSVKMLYWNRRRTGGERKYNEGFYVPIKYDLRKVV